MCCGCGVVMESRIMDDRPTWCPEDSGVGADHRRAKRARRECCATEDPRDASLRAGLREVDRLVSCFRLSSNSNIAITARELFKDVHEARGVRADARRAMAAAAVYYGCKLEDAGRELKMVSDVCEVDPRALNAAVSAYKEALPDKPYYPRLFARLQAGKLIDVCLDRLRLPVEVRKRMWRAAHRLDERLVETMDCGRKPKSLCSGVLFLAASHEGLDSQIGKREIATACSVNQQTIVNVVAHIRASLPDLPPA